MKLLTPEELDLNLKAATDAKDTNHMAAVFYVVLTELKLLREARLDTIKTFTQAVSIGESTGPVEDRMTALVKLAKAQLPE